jgi:TonB family protein
MRWLLAFSLAVVPVTLLAHSQSATLADPAPRLCNPDSPQPSAPIEVLGNSKRIDLGPYMAEALKTVRTIWYSMIPDEARPPVRKKGCVAIDFSVSGEGALRNVKIAVSSGDEQLDQAALQALLTSSPLPRPPEDSIPQLRLRFHFYYNPDFAAVSPGLIESADALLSKSMVTMYSPPPTRSENPPPVHIDFIPMGGQTPRGLYAPMPLYTLPTGSAPLCGVVLLSLTVTKKGDVRHVKVVQGLSPDVDRTARKTVETWKFEPATRYGKAIEMPLDIRVTYNLK